MSQKSFPLQSGPFSLEVIVTEDASNKECRLIGRVRKTEAGYIISAVEQAHGRCTQRLINALFAQLSAKAREAGILIELSRPFKLLKNDVLKAYKK